MSALTGSALVRDLEKRFVTATQHIETDARAYELLRPDNADALITEEDFVRDGRLPYWADVWPSSRLLASRVKEDSGRGQRLLELGCGVGIVSIAALSAGYDVLATDYYEDALLFTRANAWRALGREPEVRLVDWRHWPEDLGIFDRVVASDVLYEPEYASLVAQAIDRALSATGTALIADPGRIACEEFLQRCEEKHLKMVTQMDHPYTDGEIKQTIVIYELKRR
ncbi:MAG: methyltransferase [Gemmatimonadaceae bacterium]